MRCEALCDAAEGGQIFLSSSAAALLEEEDSGNLVVRDIGERMTRRSGSRLRAFELLATAPADAQASTAPE
jgi:hypothetical protein